MPVSECWEGNTGLNLGLGQRGKPREVSPVVCPARFCGGASAAGLPGTPGTASVEMDLCPGQHWKQGTITQGKRYIWGEKQEKC